MKIKRVSKSKLISSFIIGTLLMFSIIISVLSMFTKFILLNPDKYINVLEKNSIYTQMYDFLDGNLEYALAINSIDISVKDGVITEDELKLEVNSFIRSFFNYFTTGVNEFKEVDIDKYISRFNENLDNYIKENSIFLNDNAKRELESLKVEISQIIKSELELLNKDIIVNSSVGNIAVKATKLFVSGFYLAPIALVLVLILILNFIWKSNIMRFLQWVGNSLISSGLFIFILFFSGYISGFYNNVIIDIIYLREFISNLIKGWMETLSVIGLCICIFGIFMLIPLIKNYIKRSKMIKKEKKD